MGGEITCNGADKKIQSNTHSVNVKKNIKINKTTRQSTLFARKKFKYIYSNLSLF